MYRHIRDYLTSMSTHCNLNDEKGMAAKLHRKHLKGLALSMRGIARLHCCRQ
jgi:hypothetical protein